MKKTISLLLILLLLFAIIPSASASNMPKVVDNAGLLTDTEAALLESEAESLTNTYQMDVVLVTVDSLDGSSAERYADDYFDYHGYGCGPDYSGILLLVSMGEREWAITTCGKAIQAVTDYGLELIEDRMLSDLSDGDYYSAFWDYLDQVGYLFQQHSRGDTVDRVVYDQPASHRSSLLGSILIRVLIAAAISGLATWVMAAKMNSARKQPLASAYLVRDSFKLSNSRDIFLYSNTTRTRKQEHSSGSSSGHSGGSSVHTSSSGRSHGGRSGRF